MTTFFGHVQSIKHSRIELTHPPTTDTNTYQNTHVCFRNDNIAPNKVNNLIISYSGNPIWLTPTLQKVHKSQGFAASIELSFKKDGMSFLNHLTGGFIVAIHDEEQNKTIVATDKMGIGRLVYSQENGLSFSDSIKTIHKFSNNIAEHNQQAIFDYIYFHMIPSPNSFYTGIEKLEPAHYIEYSNDRLSKTRYWEPTFSETGHTDCNLLKSKLYENIKNAVQRSIPDDSVGAFLSGGLDSSTVSGMLAEFRSSPDTFTIGFDAEGYDETPYARIASRHFKTNHHEYFVTPQDVLDAVPKIAAAYDEPFGNSSAIPTYFCAKLAKENGCNTLLAGDGGDEIFAGNDRYAKQKLFESYNNAPSFIHALVNAPYKVSKNLKNKPFFSKGHSFLKQAATPLPHRMENYNFLHQISPKTIFSPSLLNTIDTEYPINHLSEYYHLPKQASTLNRMQYMDWKRTLADNDLRKVSHMCELAGIDVKYPFLDSELIDFSCSIPSNIKLPGTKLRQFYKQAMTGFLPNEILTKSKHGFGLPFGVWMKTNKDLQALAYDNITALKSRHFFNSSFLDNAIEQHRSGHASYYGELIWVLMMLELWLQSR